MAVDRKRFGFMQCKHGNLQHDIEARGCRSFVSGLLRTRKVSEAKVVRLEPEFLNFRGSCSLGTLRARTTYRPTVMGSNCYTSHQRLLMLLKGVTKLSLTLYTHCWIRFQI